MTRAARLRRHCAATLCVCLASACQTTTVTVPEQHAPRPVLTTGDIERPIDPATFDFTGEGTLRWPDGRVQRGQWRNGKLDGRGEEIDHGATYEGEWRAGERHGRGIQTDARGGRYEGFWAHDLRDGIGEQTYPDRSVYQGEWAAGKRAGQGTFADSRGAWYDGAWQADHEHGYGTIVYPNQVRYEGMWQRGERSGFGEEQRPDGSVYRGAWRNGRPHGAGEEHFANGSQHVGEWEDGHILGNGTRTDSLGIRISGAWVGDQISQGMVELPDGNAYAGAIFAERGRVLTERFRAYLDATAGLGSAYAQYLLALSLLDEHGDREGAIAWLERAAVQELAEAQYLLAQMLKDEEWSRAETWLQRAALLDHPGACALLGEFYYLGHHYPQDLSQAVSYFEAAMAGGNLGARNNLAWMLATTQGQWADPERAAELIQPLVLYLDSYQLLDTFAAAQARLGRFELAVSLQARAVDQLRAAVDGTPETAATLSAMEERLGLYRENEPYVE